jgi:O-antigen/teichoic acid export membrane protein
MERLRRLSHGVSLKAMTTVFEVLVGLTISVALNRIYGATQYGQFVLVYAVTAFAFALSDFGIKMALIRFVPEALKQGQHDRTAALCAAALMVQLAGLTLVGGTLLLLSRPIAVTVYDQPALFSLVRVGVVYVTAFGLLDFFLHVYQAFQDWRHEALLTISYGLLRITSVVTVGILLGGTLADILLGNAAAAILTVVLAIVWLPHWLRAAARPRLGVIWHEAKSSLRFGLPLSLQGTYRFGIVWLDKLLLGRFVAPAELAMYYIATLFLNGLVSLFKVLPKVFAPYVSGLAGAERPVLERNFELIYRWLTQAAVMSALVMFVSVDLVVAVTYGPSYLPVASMVRLLMVVYLLRVCRDPFVLFLTNVFGRVRVLLATGTVLTVATFISTPVLVSAFGVTGAIAAAIVSQLVTWIAFFWLAPEVAAMAPSESVRATGLALAIGAGAYTTAALAGYQLIGGIMLIVGYASALFLLGEIKNTDVRIAIDLVRANRNSLQSASQRVL